MATLFDSADSDREFGVTTATTPGFTISGSNRAAVVTGIFKNTGVSSITGSCGGQSLSAITGASGNGTGFKVHMMGCVAPATGSQNASLSWTTACDMELGVISVTDANQTGGTTTFANGNFQSYAFGAGAKAITITSANGDLTITSIGQQFGSSNVPTSDQTDRWNASNIAAGDTGPGTGTTVHTWTLVDGDNAAIAGVSVVAAAGGGGPVGDVEDLLGQMCGF